MDTHIWSCEQLSMTRCWLKPASRFDSETPLTSIISHVILKNGFISFIFEEVPLVEDYTSQSKI